MWYAGQLMSPEWFPRRCSNGKLSAKAWIACLSVSGSCISGCAFENLVNAATPSLSFVPFGTQKALPVFFFTRFINHWTSLLRASCSALVNFMVMVLHMFDSHSESLRRDYWAAPWQMRPGWTWLDSKSKGKNSLIHIFVHPKHICGPKRSNSLDYLRIYKKFLIRHYFCVILLYEFRSCMPRKSWP